MRRHLCGVALALFAVAGLMAQSRPPQNVQQAASDRIKAFAQKQAEAMAAKDARLLGSLSDEGNAAIKRWDEAVRLWKKEKAAGAGPWLAEGVLFDCVSRLHGIVTAGISSEPTESRGGFIDVTPERPARAAKAFQAALKIDPALTEARFRFRRIRARDDVESRRDLERLSMEPDGLIAYLAAMSRAETARALGDPEGAQRWYARAAELRPDAPAPRIGLASLGPPRPLPFETLQAADPYYAYPCTILTTSVDAGLASRTTALRPK